MIRLRQRSHRVRIVPERPREEILQPKAQPLQSTCPFCGAVSIEKFRAIVLGKHEACYASCTSCASLHVIAPHWLDEAYADPGRADEIDSGAAWRNAVLTQACVAMAELAPAGSWLDYGSGLGLLVAALQALDYPIHGHDPLRGVVADPGRHALVVCFEVLEHQIAPRDFATKLREALIDDGILLVSTCLAEPAHGPSWSYLAMESGQHVAFASEAGLRSLAQHAGLSWWASGVHREHAQLQLHVFSPRADAPAGVLERLGRVGFAAQARS